MPTTEELLEQLEQEAFVMPDEQVYCVIDPDTRQISVPAEYQLLGVESDEKAERIWFQCPKIVGDNIDLSQLQIRVNYQNANNQKDQYIVTDVQSEGDNIIFSWLLSRKVTAYRGSVSFIVCAVRVSGETIQNEWNTTLATAQVLQGLEVDDPEITEEESDVIAQLLQIMTDTSEQAVSDVNTAKTSAISAITSQQQTSVSAVQSAQSAAVSAVENAGKLIEESLPSDYTELSNKVDELDRTKAPAITESTSGESIQLSDSGDAPLTDIKLYGKSKQVTTTGAQLWNGKYVTTSLNQEYDSYASERIPGNLSMPVTPGKQYTFSVAGKESQLMRYKFNDSDSASIGNFSNAKTTVEAPENAVTMTWRWYDSGENTYNEDDVVMLNAGSSALSWEPYTGGQPSPSPDYPQEIQIPGSDGNVEITASDGDEQIKNVTLPTPNGLPGIPVTSGGNYTDADGQQWVCDEIDYARGKYVQRVLKKNVKLNYVEYSNNAGYRYTYTYADGLYKGAEMLSTKFKYNDKASNSMGDKTFEGIRNSETYNKIVAYSDERIKEGINTDILIQLSAPIETDLTTEQLTALKQLRTYQTVTNITTDSEPQVGMEVEYTADTKTWIENKFTELAQSLAATQNTLLQEV